MINIINRTVDLIDDISVMNDCEVIRLDFKCNNQVTELLKLTDCDKVYINYQNGQTKDRYLVTDLTLDGDSVTFSWLLGKNATKSQGKTFFVVCAQITENDEIKQEWNTVLASFNVQKGLETVTQETEPLEDIFSQLVDMIDGKQDKLIAGDNIKIENNVISAEGGTVDAYTKSETDALLSKKQNKDYIAIYTKNGTWECNRTFAEISAAKASGARVYAYINSIGLLLPLEDLSGTTAHYRGVFVNDSGTVLVGSMVVIIHDDEENIGIESQGLQNVLTAGAGISITNGVISATAGITFEVVQVLPQDGNTQTIYLIANSGTAPNIYDEYIYVNNAWEKIGTTDIDLSGYVTTEVMNTALAVKLDKADVATSTGNSDTKAISQKAATDAINNIKPARWLFVDTLPTSDIDTKAAYLTPNSRIFPSVESYIADDWGKGAVTYDELTGYKFIRIKTTSDILYNDSRNKSAEYEIYTTDGVVWTKVDESAEGGDNEWATAMGWTTATTTTGSTSGYQNIVWSNCTFCYNQNTYKHYNPDNNTAYITGLLVDVSQLNPFIKMMSTYNGSAWTDIGVCDFTKLFDGVKMQASKVTVTDGTTYTMADNTEYYGDNLLQPVFNSPTGDYECYFLLSFASSGTVGGAGDIFPDITRVIGDVPIFDNGETWEISIKNGIFVAGKVE